MEEIPELEGAPFLLVRQGDYVQVFFPNGGSVDGILREIHLERPGHEWVLIEQPNGALTTIYEKEVGHADAYRDGTFMARLIPGSGTSSS